MKTSKKKMNKYIYKFIGYEFVYVLYSCYLIKFKKNKIKNKKY